MRISRLGQIKVYTRKCFRLFLADKKWKNFISALIIILLICLVTGSDMFKEYTDTKKGSFAVICACIWVGLFNSIQSVCSERSIIKREHRTGLHISSYITAHVLYEMAVCAVEAFIIFSVFLAKNYSHLPESNGSIALPLTDMYITLFLVTFCSDMMALIVSCTVKKESTAMTVMPFILIIQLIMSGMLFELEGITEKISSLTVSRWGLNAMITISNTSVSVKNGYDIAVKNEPIAGGCEPEPATLMHLWSILILFAIVYIVISTLLLERVDKDKR